MFEIGIKEVDKKISEIRREFEDFESKYGKQGITVKLNLQGATAEVENLVAALKGIGDIQRIKEYENQVKQLKAQIDQLQTSVNATGSKEAESSDKAVTATNRYLKLLQDVENKVANIRNIAARGEGLKIDMSAIGVAEQAFTSFFEKMRNINSLDNGKIKELSSEFALLKSQFADVIKQSDAFSKSIQKINTKQTTEYARQHARAEKENAEGMITAGRAAEELYRKLKLLETRGVRQNAIAAGVDVSALDAAISRMERYRNVLSYISQNGGHDPSRIINSAGFMRASTELTLQIENTKRLTSEQNKNATATNQLSAEQQRLATALNSSSSSMRSQSQILGELKTLATQYLGVWGAQNFLNNIIQIGGQLEMQRLSIGAILGDAAHATDLFDKIKALAIKSPFGVVELDQMSKQLSAYGFQYSELYDMTKRLADISAATGTEVSRLSLALGHVRSEAALSGYTLRQFSMANIPLAKKLSEYLTKIEGKLVSVADVRARVRKKDIGYEEVEQVIKDLTSEGGMFYNAQEVMSQSVKAKFKNLKDAMAIMYGEIAESAVGFGLKDIASNLTEITRRWKEVGTAAGTALLVFGGSKAALMAYNSLLGKNAAAAFSTIAAHRKAEAANLRYASSYRTLTAAENAQLSTSTKLTLNERLRMMTGVGLTEQQKKRVVLAREQVIMDTALALSEKKLTTEDIARRVALGSLTKSEARRIIILSDLSAAEKKVGLSAVANVATYGRMTGVVNGAAMAFSRLGAALKSMLLSPQMWIFALIGGVMELWQKNKIENERAQDMNKKLFERAQEGIKNTRTMLENTGISLRLDGKDISAQNFGNPNVKGASLAFPAASKLSKAEMSTMIDEWTQYVKEYAATPNRIINDAMLDNTGKVRSLTEQYEKLRDAVTSVANAQLLLKESAEAAEIAMNATNGNNGTALEWLDDDLSENIKDAENAVMSYNNAVSMLNSKYASEVSGILKAAKGNAEYAEAVEKLDQTLMEREKRFSTNMEQIELLTKNYGEFGDAIKLVNKYVNDSNNAELMAHWGNITNGSVLGFGGGGSKKMLDAFNTMEKDAELWAQNYRDRMEGYGWKFGQAMTEGQRQAAAQAFSEMLKESNVTSDEVESRLKSVFERVWGITISDNALEEIKKVNELEEHLRKVCGGEWNIDIKGSSDVVDVIDKIRKEYSSAKQFIESNKIQMEAKFGIKVDAGAALWTDEWIKAKANGNAFAQQYLEGVRQAMQVINQATTASKSEGFSLEKKTSKSGKKTGSKGSKEDKDAKDLRERIRILKEAADSYKYWRKAVGETGAEAHVQEEFGEVLQKLGYGFKDVTQLRKTIMAEVRKYEDIYNKTGKKRPQLLEAIKEGYKADAGLGRNEFEESVTDLTSRMQIEIDTLTRAWEIFNNVRDATGDVEFAIRISGAEYSGGKTRNLADALKDKLKKDFAVAPIDFDLGLSDREIEEMVQKSLPKESENRIKALVEEYKRWRDLQRDVLKNDIDVFSKLIGSSVSYAAQIKKINDEYNEQIESLKALREGGKISNEQFVEASSMLSTKREQSIWEKDTMYINLMNNSLSMTRNEIEFAAQAQENMLNRRLRDGLITAKEYTDEMKNLHDIMQGWENDGFLGMKGSAGAFLGGGNNGLLQYYLNRANKARTEYANAADQDSEYAQGKKKEAEHYEELYKALAKLTDEAGKIVNAFQTLQSGIELIGNFFDAAGMEGAANSTSAVGGILSGALGGASSLSSLGPWGMAAGAALGVATAMFQQHDKDIQREIDAINNEVKALDQNTEAIKRSRERTLGYDTGLLRRQMQGLYSDLSVTRTKKIGSFEWSWTEDSAAKKAMREYYGTNTSGTGYSQELSNLKKQREDYIKMYDLENDKKKKSQDSLMEYKSKIAELDDQIAYFAQDLAQEMFGIDLKGWADEIGDALMNAFENGEDAAEAFKDTVQGIMRKVLRQMLSIGIIQPMMEKLQKKLFGTNGKGGSFDAMNPEGTIDNAMRDVAEFFSPNGEGYAMINATQTFYEKWEEYMRSQGMTLSSSEKSSSSASNSIKSISEQTADLLASYLNSTRADVSVQRALLDEYMPMFFNAMTQGNASLRNLESRAQEISISNAAIERNTAEVVSLMNGLRFGTWRLPMS